MITHVIYASIIIQKLCESHFENKNKFVQQLDELFHDIKLKTRYENSFCVFPSIHEYIDLNYVKFI